MINIKQSLLNPILRRLANLKFAISLLCIIGFLISIGTIIEQDQTINFYKTNYPDTNPIFGFVDWRLIFFLNLNIILILDVFIKLTFSST